MLLEPLPALQDNYIWLLRDGQDRAVIVDPGDATPVLGALDAAPAPHAILLTHHHNDHIGGVAALIERWPGTPVFAPDDGRISEPTRTVREGDLIDVGPWRFSVLEIPGHTRSHVAYYCADAGSHALLFCGDTLFSLGCGRMFEGSPPQMHASLMRLAALPAETLVCCGHEYTLANAAFASQVEPANPQLLQRSRQAAQLRANGKPTLPSRLGEECACNPFLRCDAASVRQAAELQAGHPLETPGDVFGALRAWKDGFRG